MPFMVYQVFALPLVAFEFVALNTTEPLRSLLNTVEVITSQAAPVNLIVGKLLVTSTAPVLIISGRVFALLCDAS